MTAGDTYAKIFSRLFRRPQDFLQDSFPGIFCENEVQNHRTARRSRSGEIVYRRMDRKDCPDHRIRIKIKRNR